jgi:3-oxoacyl-(acyl-carrier-protein) synthase
MGVITPIADHHETFVDRLLEGRSAVTRWQFFDDDRVYAKVGGDLSSYDAEAKLAALSARLPDAVAARLRKVFRGAPFSTRLSILCAVDAWLDAGLPFPDGAAAETTAVIVGGHNLGENYLIGNYRTFQEEPDWIDAHAALLTLDTDHAGSVSDVLGTRGAQFTVGGACASSNIALRSALDEIVVHGHERAVVVGPTFDFSPMGLHAMALMGAITFQGFNDAPAEASRPYDVAREGFVPSHGTAVLILEDLALARARGATVYGELLAAVATSDGNHLPNPSPEGQARTIIRTLDRAGVDPTEVDFVSAHATSTPLGDLSELQAIRSAFGAHADRLKINAPKSMLGHTCWSAPAVETVAALGQMRRGRLHRSINIDRLDPAVDLDVCADGPVDHAVEVMLKNSFGFGGTNCCALWRRVD